MSNFAPKTILCPVDMGPATPAILRWAGYFAAHYGARVRILHAEWFEYPPYFLSSQTQELAGAAKRSRAVLEKLLDKLVRENLRAGIPYEIEILEGHPLETILARLARLQPDLIILGSHGRSGLERMRLGSIAESILQKSTVPALILKTPEVDAAAPGISRILCPVNFTAPSKNALLLAADVASSFGAQLVALHAEEEGKNAPSSREQLCGLVSPEARDRCKFLEVIRQGDAAEQILLAAREHVADLLTLAATHRRFLDFTVMGTTTERVIRHAAVPVLVLPAEKGAAE